MALADPASTATVETCNVSGRDYARSAPMGIKARGKYPDRWADPS